MESESIQPKPGDSLEWSIAETREQVLRAARQRVCWIAGASLAAVGWGFLILDRSIEPSPEVRRALWVVLLLIIVAWIVLRAAPLWWSKLSDLEIAKLLSHHLPQGGDAVVTSVQMQEEVSDPRKESLIRATRSYANQAIERAGTLDLVRDPSRGGWAFAALILWIAAIGLSIISPQTASYFVKRALLSPENWPRAVRLEPTGFTYDESRGEWTKKVARGSRVEVFVEAFAERGHSTPRQLEAHVKRSAIRTERMAFARVGSPAAEGARQRFRLGDQLVDEDLRVRVSGGDASIVLRLLAVGRPVLTGLVAQVSPPNYLGHTVSESDALTLTEIPEGSDLLLAASFNKPIASTIASFTPSGDPTREIRVNLREGALGFTIEAPLVMETGELTIGWTDTDGVPCESRFRLPINVRRDQPPTAELSVEGVGGLITPRALLQAITRAADDHAVSSIKLMVSIDEQDPVLLPIDADSDKRVRRESKIDLLSLRDRSGATIEAAPVRRSVWLRQLPIGTT